MIFAICMHMFCRIMEYGMNVAIRTKDAYELGSIHFKTIKLKCEQKVISWCFAVVHYHFQILFVYAVYDYRMSAVDECIP